MVAFFVKRSKESTDFLFIEFGKEGFGPCYQLFARCECFPI